MFKEIESAVFDYGMFDGKKNVTVALSGGADSMCLLHYLVMNAGRFGVNVSAAHLNHCLRGEESERDFLFADDMCRRFGVKFFSKKCDISKIAKEKKIGLEECGREERYRFFEELSDGETVVATAHTASDNAETILLNITRGCGLEGLTGIPPVRGNIVRPLIRCSREQIERYCSENSVPFVTDSSNLSDEYSRNKIRLSVIPVLKTINPSVERSLNRLSGIAANKNEFIGTVCKSEYMRCKSVNGLSIEKLRACDDNILSDVLVFAVNNSLGITAEKKHIDIMSDIVRNGFGAVEIRKGRIVRAENSELVFEDTSKRNKVGTFQKTPFAFDAKINYNHKTYIISPKKTFSASESDKINKMLLNRFLSCDIISCDTVLRTRESGDVFKLPSRNCTKTLKKLFTEMKIPLEKRNNLLVLANGNRILWIEGIGASADAAVKSFEKSYFTIDVEGNEIE